MIYSILIMFVFSVILIIKNYKNKFTWMFIFMFSGLTLSLFAILLYIIKLSNYRAIFTLDNYMYIALSKLTINFYNVSSMINIGISIFLFSLWCFASFYTYRKHRFALKNIIKGILTFLPIMFYLYVNSPQAGKTFYLMINTTENEAVRDFLNRLLDGIHFLNYLIIIFYLLYPFWVISKSYRATQIKFKKVHSIIFCICLLLMDAFFVSVFIIGPFRHLSVNNRDLLKFSDTWPEYTQYFYTYMPLVILLVLEVIFYFLIRFKLLDRVDIMKKLVISRNSQLLAKDVRTVFHSYKNTLLSIEILEMKVEKDYGTEKGLENLKEIKTMARDSMNAVSRFLDMFNELRITIDAINVIDCVKEALNKALIPNNIKITNMINVSEILILGDYHHITEMFRNLLLNAVDAIKENATEHGEILVSMECEDDWVCIYVQDNGSGISKKDLKKVFNPLFSTKNTYQNWGIGLSYVYKVASAHLGYVFVESELKKFTRFQILLPTLRGSDKYEQY